MATTQHQWSLGGTATLGGLGSTITILPSSIPNWAGGGQGVSGISGQTWITTPQYTIPMPTPYGCNLVFDDIKLIVLTIKTFNDVMYLSPQVNDIVFCLDTKQYWQCVSTETSSMILPTISNTLPDWQQVIITESLEVIKVVEPVDVKTLNQESQDLYEAFEKELSKNNNTSERNFNHKEKKNINEDKLVGKDSKLDHG